MKAFPTFAAVKIICLMKNYWFPLMTLLLMTLLACQKEETITPAPPVTKSPRLKSIDYEGYISNYFYDTRGRVVKTVFSDSTYCVFNYFNGYYVQQLYNIQGQLTDQYTYELNADSLISRVTKLSIPGYERVYEYDSKHRLIRESSKNQADEYLVEYFFGAGGNQDSSAYSKNGQWQYSYTYTFMLNQPNVYTLQVFGELYAGEESKNLMSSFSAHYTNGTSKLISLFDYTFDDQGRIASMYQATNGQNGTFYFTYE
jgi:hypothetical protein